MPTYKLTYFNVRYIAEPIRYLLSYMGIEFQDVRLKRDQWLEKKNSMPFGKIPILEIDGKTFHQSSAICRYLGNKAGLSGKTLLENLQIDQIVGASTDLNGEVSKFLRSAADPATKEQNRQTVVHEILPFYFKRFEEVLKNNNGYLANGKLSWADIYLVGSSESLPEILLVPITDKYPHFSTLQRNVQSLPGIKEWIKRRPVSQF